MPRGWQHLGEPSLHIWKITHCVWTSWKQLHISWSKQPWCKHYNYTTFVSVCTWSSRLQMSVTWGEGRLILANPSHWSVKAALMGKHPALNRGITFPNLVMLWPVGPPSPCESLRGDVGGGQPPFSQQRHLSDDWMQKDSARHFGHATLSIPNIHKHYPRWSTLKSRY